MVKNSVRMFWRDPAAAQGFRTGISIHSHTLCSKERLSFLPVMVPLLPGGAAVLRKVEAMHENGKGEKLDYSRGWWTPPLSPQHAYNLEANQIADKLGLSPLVSLSDHDNIEAASMLQLMDGYRDAPISVEWTISYSLAKFHLGIHNLPRESARQFITWMNEFTDDSSRWDLRELLDALHAIDDVLIVLNHPLSDEGRVGRHVHTDHVKHFLHDCGRWIHALELNGLQPWKDNSQVSLIAREFDLPLISGGDRHGCEPNANVNVTNAQTFGEFVHEIRRDRVSNLVFMPHYREPLKIRYLENIWHILRYMPDNPGRERWCDRAYYQMLNDEPRPIAALTNHVGIQMFNRFINLIGLLASRPVRPALKLVWSEQEGGYR